MSVSQNWLCRLQTADRVPGAAVSAAVDFLIPGLEGFHFVAYGSSQGSVVVACARQLDQIGSKQVNAELQGEQLQTLLVLDLRQPPAATATTVSVSSARTASPAAPVPTNPASAHTAAPSLDEPVLHVAYGGGPHLLLAACTYDTLVVVSLEGLAAHLFHQQTSGGGTSVAAAGHRTLWQQLAAVHCGPAEVLAISWTQQLDGILTSSSDGRLAMWEMRPLARRNSQRQLQDQQQPGSTALLAAVLRAAWSVHAPIPQRLICAGVSVYAPSATAAGCAALPDPAAGASPLKGAGQRSNGSAPSSPTHGGSDGARRYASVWWPQIREQRQQHYAAGMPPVGQEKLRHPAPVTGVQWSPGVLQKDALAASAAGATGGATTGAGSPSWATGNEPGSPTTAAAVAATEAEDHPALMTLTEDGTVRVWVETLVLTENISSSMPVVQPMSTPTPLHRRSSGHSPGSGPGSPGASPSSPREARKSAAAAAALGAAAPAITSYFCMALVIDSAATAAGAAAAAAAAASPASGSSPMGARAGGPRPHVALWARHAEPHLLHKQQRRVAAPVLWLFTATVESRAGGSICRVFMHLHAVRGLAAIVMSAGYGGSLSSTSGGSASTRPAAVLWGQHSWDLPASAMDTTSLPQLLQRLCCWVSDEESYPLLHAFTSSAGDGGSKLLLAGRTFATVQEEGPMGSQVHKQLAVVSTWQAAAVAHEQRITAFAASSSGWGGGSSDSSSSSVSPRTCGSRNGRPTFVASCDSSGRLLLWSGTHLQHLAAVPAAAVGSLATLAWLPLEATPFCSSAQLANDTKQPQQAQAAQQTQQWLAVGSGSMLQCYAVTNKQAVAVATAALPAGCSSITSLHALDGSDASRCLLLAICSSSAGRGSMACLWQCSPAPGAGPVCSLMLQLAGTAQVPASTAVACAATAGGQQVVVGLSDGAVLLLSVVAGSAGVELQQAARLDEQGPASAVAADEHCLHIASASQAGVSVWTAAADSSADDADGTAWYYSRAASVPLPAGAGAATAVAWLRHMPAPCLAVGTSGSSVFLLSTIRDAGGSSSWQWLAELPAAVGSNDASGVMFLAAGSSGCSSLMAAAGNQLMRLSDRVLLPPSEAEEGDGTQLLGRLLLERAGPLPQYHPNFLAALLLSGKHGAAAAVYQRLVAWLSALQQQAEAGSVLEVTALQPPSPGMHIAGDARAGSDHPCPSFAGLPLADMVDSQLMRLPSLLESRSMAAGALAAAPNLPAPPASAQQLLPAHDNGMLDLAAFGMAQPPDAQPALQQQPAGGDVDSGMLDLAAFGMAALPTADPALQQQQQQQQAPEGGNLDSGMLDLAAFGMEALPAAAPPSQQPQAGGSIDSGMLDLAAFGMASPPAAEPASQQQQQPPAGGSIDSGMLDLAAFGMASPPAAEPASQQQQQPPAGGSIDSGMLDLAAFGMAALPAAEPASQQQQQPPAGGSIDSGMLDLAAFGMAALPAAEPASQQQQQPPAGDSIDNGMLDLAAFGMAALPAAEPAAQQQPVGSSIDSGMLDLAAFGMAPQMAAETAGNAHRAQDGAAAGIPARTAAPSTQIAGTQRRTKLLTPPRQPTMNAEQLLPVAADCHRQLQALLLPASALGEDAEEDDASTGRFGGAPASKALSSAASLRHFLRPNGSAAPKVAAAIPGLSLAETEAVLAIAGAFCGASAAAGSGLDGGSNSNSSAPVDTAAAHFITAVSLACATGSRGQQPGGVQQLASQPQRVTVMNAAGVAYTLAPSAVVGQTESSSSDASGSVGQQWGLLAGLDATALMWALLSGTEEAMLQQCLRRLQELEAAASAAAAAAESADAATFHAVRAATADPALDVLSSWAQLQQLGAGFWLRDGHVLTSMAERLAKQQFAARRNADDCALLYCALGKRTVLQGLYRSTQNRKLAEFLARDFQQEQHRQAAQKNAFVLMGQHRHELAAAFFILGNDPDAAIGVAANDMKDPQLALLLCRLLHGTAGSAAEVRLLQQLREAAEACASGDAAAGAAACCWLQGDADAAVEVMLQSERAKLRAAVTAEHAAQLLPLLHLLLAADPPHDARQQADWQRHVRRCMCALTAALQGCGLHALAIQAAVAARLDRVRSNAGAGGQQHELLEQLLAVALLPGVLEQHERGQRHLEADAAYQLDMLQQQGVALDSPAILAHLRRLRRGVLVAGQHSHSGVWVQPAPGPRPLERQLSSGSSSYRSRDSEQARWQLTQQPQQQQRHGMAVLSDGQVLFRIDNDKLEGVACCPLMSPDVLGRPVVVASHRHGLVEGQLHVVHPEPLSPLQEVPDSPEAAAAALLEEEQQQRGGVFSRLISQLFDQSTWQQDPTWHHGTAEFDVIGAAAEAHGSISSPLGHISASNVSTTAVAAHPHKQLYLTGCSSGRLHLWQFGEQQALATYTPVPGSELASISKTFSGLLSFSRSFKQSSAAPRLANWGKAAAVRFAPSGERFAAVGEGGVVATWRMDAPTRQADGDGHGCAEWWHQALSKQGCAVDFVGGSSSVLVVGGRCLPSTATTTASGIGSSNLSVWDTMAPTASSCVGRLSNHQCTVTAVSMLPGGWLLAAGDAEGGLSCTDLRMMGGSSGPRLLWSVKAARGSLRSVVPIPGSTGGGTGAALQLGRAGGSALLATAGADGAVRVWRGADGRLLQSIEGAHFSSRPPSAGSRRSSYDGGAPRSPAAGHAQPGAHPLPVTGLAVSEEGLVSVGSDGCVRLFSFLQQCIR